MSVGVTRREFLRASAAIGTQAVAASSLFALGCDLSFYGPLLEPDENGIRLPVGFRSRVLARSGDVVAGSCHIWHEAPDGGAVFETNDGWIYTSNSELTNGGGVSALRFGKHGAVVDAYSICSDTRKNCAGGATPWGTWLTCEEVSRGQVFECDPEGRVDAISRPALGSFKHEAVAVDPHDRRLYLTEDRPDGLLYRFTPNAWEDLGSGVLEALHITPTFDVTWVPIPSANPSSSQLPTRRQAPTAFRFNGGEGIVYDDGVIYFVTKGDNRVWAVDLITQRIRVVYYRANDELKNLRGVDNLALTPDGDLLVAEDGGNMELILLTLDGVGLPLLRVEGQAGSELAGPAFDPRGRRLYFSSQRGSDGHGITYEVRGPFQSMRWRSIFGSPSEA